MTDKLPENAQILPKSQKFLPKIPAPRPHPGGFSPPRPQRGFGGESTAFWFKNGLFFPPFSCPAGGGDVEMSQNGGDSPQIPLGDASRLCLIRERAKRHQNGSFFVIKTAKKRSEWGFLGEKREIWGENGKVWG